MAGIVDLSEAPSDAVAAIYERELIGVRISAAWTAEECAAADRALDEVAITPHRIHPTLPLVIYGKMLAPSALEPRGPSLDDYFEGAKRDADQLETMFGGRFQSRLAAVLSRAAGDRPARLLEQPAAHRPATVREIGPRASAAGHFDTYADAACFEHLHTHTDRAVQLSFYLQLRSPEGGGQLEVAGVHREQGETARLAPREPVELEVGDLILFDAANHWHLVTEVHGSRARRTVGGFAASSADHAALYFWG